MIQKIINILRKLNPVKKKHNKCKRLQSIPLNFTQLDNPKYKKISNDWIKELL